MTCIGHPSSVLLDDDGQVCSKVKLIHDSVFSIMLNYKMPHLFIPQSTNQNLNSAASRGAHDSRA